MVQFQSRGVTTANSGVRVNADSSNSDPDSATNYFLLVQVKILKYIITVEQIISLQEMETFKSDLTHLCLLVMILLVERFI